MGRHYHVPGAGATLGFALASCTVVLFGAVLLVACGTQTVDGRSPGSSGPPAAVQPDPSLPARTAASAAPDADIATLAAANNEFSLAFFKKVRVSGQNVVCSPYSLSTALSMTMAGAKGKTFDEMKQVLRLTLPEDALYPAINALDQSLIANGAFATANALWVQTGRQLKQPFVDVTGRYYDAALHVYDMDADYPGACKIINQWASDKTGGRIKDLMNPDEKPYTPILMMLLNAVHFKADWAQPFWPNTGWTNPFYLPSGDKKDVPMMAIRTNYAYLKTDALEAVELPYEDGRYSMVVLMPAKGTLDDFLTATDDQGLADVIGRLKSGRVELAMPRFEITSKPLVADALKSLGMNTAFSPDADFSGMADPPAGANWCISDVVQKAFITVNESGTEAAAVTGITMAATASSTTEPPVVPITIDHPFVYLIRDMQTGAIIFIGQVTEPIDPGA
jgi:serpin B